jgi:type I restriction-modification system DNA methylase subunit
VRRPPYSSTLQRVAGDVGEDTELAVAFAQWRRFLSLAYGEFDDSSDMFLVHTYLSVFAKLIAHAVVAGRATPNEAAIREVLDGTAFQNLNIERFVEDDFFHWVHSEAHFQALRPMFREIARRIAEYEFDRVSEDILKGVYQDLIDLETRHALGEYYTPDWLCEKVVDAVPIARDSKVLDPACGSGSFLRAVIARLRRDHDDLDAEDIAARVAGIDIHPLSVQISKTTVLLALGDLIQRARRPVSLQIYLANSLLVPRGTANLFESNFEVSIDNAQFVIDVQGIPEGLAFDDLVSLCDELVGRYPEQLDRPRFDRLAAASIPEGTSPTLPAQLYAIYGAMKAAKVAGRDSIWKFILQNSYKPIFMMGRFDVIVGNPPWLTYSDVGSTEYQSSLRRLADGYGVTPINRANMPHLEIAAIFLAHSVNYFSKPSGMVAFVLPRSFMSADQHHNMRAGLIEGVRVTELWDLRGVSPLFRVPSCVVFAVKEERPARRPIPSGGLRGRSVSGRLPASHMRLEHASRLLRDENRMWQYSTLQPSRAASRIRSALTTDHVMAGPGANAYFARFKQGATMVPRNFYFVTIAQDLPEGTRLNDRVTAVRTSDESNAEAKSVWKDQLMSGRVEGDVLYRTALARNVVPYALVDPPIVTLPVVIEQNGNRRAFAVKTADELLGLGHRRASSWYSDAEQTFDDLKSESYRESGMTLQSRLDFQRGMTAQLPDAEWIVIYTASGTDASAVAVDRTRIDLPFVVDHKTYWCEVATAGEAHYLTAFLNSQHANERIKGFQSTGLYGERDIHKTIVMLPLPAFSARNDDHAEIARIAAECARSASAFAEAAGWTVLGSHHLGRARTAVRNHLTIPMAQIDALLHRGVGGPRLVSTRTRRRATPGPLFE